MLAPARAWRTSYRGRTNYGEARMIDIVGNYFQKGYEGIMAGVPTSARLQPALLGISAGATYACIPWSSGRLTGVR